MSAVSEFRHLLRGSGFRRLAAARLVSQLGDGMFQAGLASVLFFDPDPGHQSSAAGIAVGFVLLFAPFTFVGPFVGPLSTAGSGSASSSSEICSASASLASSGT